MVRTAEQPRLSIGQTLSHFRITAKLGEGGMGESMPPERITVGSIMQRTASDLRAHGLPEAAGSMSLRAVQWYRDRRAEEAGASALREELATALWMAGEIDEAREIFSSIVGEGTDDPNVRGHWGVIAAQLHDDRAVQSALAWLDELDRPYLFGGQIFWMSAIHAWQGDLEEAVRLYREALAAGFPFGWPRPHPHSDPALEPMWEYPPFRRLIEPRD